MVITEATVVRAELPPAADETVIADLVEEHWHLHLVSPTLAWTREDVARVLAARHKRVNWVTFFESGVPEGATHLHPGALGELDSDVDQAIVFDADALDAYSDPADRLAVVHAARAAGRFVLLTRA